MRYLIILACSVTMLGCASTGQKQASLWSSWFKKDKSASEVVQHSTLPQVDFSKAPTKLDQYHVGKFSVGAWVNQTPGQLFQPVNTVSPDAALVYFYRLDSRWNRQEIVAPNFFLNDQRIPSLLNNHYYWVELPAGDYRLTLSRPIGVLHFQKPKVVDFKVEKGQTYYLKYEEQQFRGAPDQSLGLLHVGPIMQMPTKQGLQEIRTTQLKTAGISFVKYPKQSNLALNENIHENKFRSVKKSQLSDQDDVMLKKPFKLWNPLTW